MEIFLHILFGFLGGILGGMGMGGGTLLIPLITIFLSVEQKSAQGINLIAFLPMAIVALIIHFKNKMVDFKNIIWFIVPGILASVGLSFLASSIDNQILKFLFGIFLILIAIYEAVELFFEAQSYFNKRKRQKNSNKTQIKVENK